MEVELNTSISSKGLVVENGSPETSVNTGRASAAITLIRRSTLHIAPEGFIFGVNLEGFDTPGPGAGEIYDPRFHEIYYFWDFDDAYKFTAPDHLLATHKNANIAYGPWASHVFRSAGTYTVTCFVVEPASGKSATATLDVTIGNPDTLFSGKNTIFMSPGGFFDNAPTDAIQTTSASVSTVISEEVLGQEVTPKRLMLNRGESYTCAGIGLMGFNEALAVPTLHIVAGGDAGARPSVTVTGGMDWNDSGTAGTGDNKDWVVQGINWQGPYDSTTGTGAAFVMFATYSSPPNLFLFDQCDMDGFGHMILNDSVVSSNVQHRATIVNDCIFKDFRDLCIGEGDKAAHAILGSYIGADVNALVDSSPNGGSPVRFGANDRLTIIHSSEFFSRQGWSGHGPNALATQANVRINSEGFEGAKANIQASSFEGGYTVLVAARAEGSTASAGNWLLEKSYLIGGYQTNDLLGATQAGATIRNNVMVMPDSLGRQIARTNGPLQFIRMSNNDSDATNAASPIRIYNNTLVNRITAAHYPAPPANAMSIFNNIGSAFTNVMVENNIEHQTDIDTPATSDAPLAQAVNLWAPYETGYQSSTVNYRSTTATSTAAGMIATYAPLTGSAALGDALDGLVAYDDFYGNPRPQYPSRGAFEMP